MDKDNPCKWKQKREGVAILILGKVEFRAKLYNETKKVI